MPDKLQHKVDYYEFLIDFVAHEIRNPLSAIIMFTRLMKEGAYGQVPPGQLEILDRILANSGRIEHMTEDFLTLGRIETGSSCLRLGTWDLYVDIITPALAAMEKKLLLPHERREQLSGQIAPGRRVIADRDLMIVVYDNLFFNAMKYGHPNAKILYDCREEGDHWLLNVWNEGQGVSPENLPEIFEKFVRLKDAAIPSQNGTGLGLFNVRRIMGMHGGTIRAESEYGRWFNVLFTLPRQPAAPGGQVADEEHPA